jgi:hypothetical protein
MATPICTRAALNLACFKGFNLSTFQRKCLLVWFKASELKGIGGTDYTAVLTGAKPGGLIYDTTQFADEKVSKDDIGYCSHIGTWQLAVARNSAVASGGDVDAGIRTRMQQIKCLYNVNEDMIDRMLLFLECQLGVHKAYPQ